MSAHRLRLRRTVELLLGMALTVFMIPIGLGVSPGPWVSAALPSTIRGIQVHYEYDRATVFPGSWLKPPVDCEGSQVPASDAKRIVPLIREFASVYGASTLHDHLTDIYLLGSLECYGKTYGGTNSTSAIYLHVGSEHDGYDAEYLLSTMHAEFSSILLREHVFPTEEWEAMNPPGFEYLNNAVSMLDEPGISEKPSPELFCGGFLTRYGASDLEDDFNEYAGLIFVEPKELCQYRIKCKAIADKAWLATEFYKAVDPTIKIPSCK
jgi:hypothetical protein